MSTLLPTVTRFIAWWGQGLLFCLPSPVRNFLFPMQHRVFIRKQGQQIHITSDEKVVGTQLLDTTQINALADVRTVWADLSLKFVILLPSQYVIRRTLELPVETVENLYQALQEQMSDYTPFRAEEVYFDYKIKGINAQSEKVLVDLAVVPIHLLEQERSYFRSLDFDVSTIAFAGDGDNFDQEDQLFTFFNEQKALEKKLPEGKLLVASLIITLVMASFYLHQKRDHEQALLEATTDQLIDEKRKAAAVKTLQETITAEQERSRFLVAKKQTSYSISDLMVAVSTTLPDDTWIIDARINKNQLTLAGFSADASRLIALLEASHAFSDIRFISPVAKDNRLKRDRFNIALKINDKIAKKQLDDDTAKQEVVQ
ncbi:PilN domain-containing protein [Kiloniella majae]|uniref:PilN domain-containing protein n=1 Tax=Kiloniella majae TaxID=1938558 RepID=UPI000A27962E|nr:PilN domain-containing protein [Kiloniella majae]